MDIQQQEEFYLSLFKTYPANQNQIFSPLSIYIALSMAAVGAKGDTLQQFLHVLNCNQLVELITKNENIKKTFNGIPQVSIANKVYHSIQNVKQEYEQVLTNHFSNNIERVDFLQNHAQIVDNINKWIEDQTRRMIKDALSKDSLGPETKMVLINAIYFKGDWVNTFDISQTKDQKFYLNNNKVGQGVKCKLMYQKNDFYYYSEDAFQYISLPYKGGQVHMEIFLPQKDISVFHQSLTQQQIQKARQQSISQQVELYLPRFSIQGQKSKDIQENLKQLGLKDCFYAGLSNFSGVTDDLNLFIAHIYHQAVVEVNEQGTKAAAVTIIQMEEEDEESIDENIIFRCDRPFIYMITTKNNQSVFIGQLNNPCQ